MAREPLPNPPGSLRRKVQPQRKCVGSGSRESQAGGPEVTLGGHVLQPATAVSKWGVTPGGQRQTGGDHT